MGFNYRANAGCGCGTDSSLENAPHSTHITMIHSPDISRHLGCPETSGGFRVVAGLRNGKLQAGQVEGRKKRRDKEKALPGPGLGGAWTERGQAPSKAKAWNGFRRTKQGSQCACTRRSRGSWIQWLQI